MTNMSVVSATNRPLWGWRVDPVLLAAAALFAMLLIGELAIIAYTRPALDPLAPFYVS